MHPSGQVLGAAPVSGLIISLHYFLYYIAIDIKVVTQQKYKTRSYFRDKRVVNIIPEVILKTSLRNVLTQNQDEFGKCWYCICKF